MGILPANEVKAMVDTVNQLANATLLEIAEPGAIEGNGDPGEPVIVWTGEAPGYFERARREAVSGERESPAKTDTFRVYDAVAPGIEISGGSSAMTVVIRDDTRSTPVTSRWTVNGTVKETEGTLDSITLELAREATP